VAFVKDLWTRPEKQADGSIKRVPNSRWGQGKALACLLAGPGWAGADEGVREQEAC
jgi:hypothetical protein